jgi:hypothetical protein
MIKYKVLTVCVVHSKELSVISVVKMLVFNFNVKASNDLIAENQIVCHVFVVKSLYQYVYRLQ